MKHFETSHYSQNLKRQELRLNIGIQWPEAFERI